MKWDGKISCMVNRWGFYRSFEGWIFPSLVPSGYIKPNARWWWKRQESFH